MATNQLALMYQIAIYLLPISCSFFPPFLLPLPTLLGVVFVFYPALYDLGGVDIVTKYLASFGYVLELSLHVTSLDWNGIQPYDGKLKWYHFVFIQLYAYTLYFNGNFVLFGGGVYIFILWSSGIAFPCASCLAEASEARDLGHNGAGELGSKEED
jgi:hypothetical protein